MKYLKKLDLSDEMFSEKVSQDFSSEEPVLQNTFPKEESSSDIITVKTTKVKLLFPKNDVNDVMPNNLFKRCSLKPGKSIAMPVTMP